MLLVQRPRKQVELEEQPGGTGKECDRLEDAQLAGEQEHDRRGNSGDGKQGRGVDLHAREPTAAARRQGDEPGGSWARWRCAAGPTRSARRDVTIVGEGRYLAIS